MGLFSRSLDPIETMLVNTHNAPTQAVDVRGRVDERVLEYAYGLLCRAYPTLRARTGAGGTGLSMHLRAEEPAPRLVVAEGGRDVLRRFADVPFDTTRATSALILVRRGATSQVALRTSHVAMDGPAWTTMFRDLWRFYTLLADGGVVDVSAETSLPESPTGVLSAAGWDVGRFGPFRGQEPSDGVRGEVSSVVESRLRLSTEDTTALVTAAHRAETTVHGLVCGALLVAQRRLDERAGTTPMWCASYVDLRRRLAHAASASRAFNLLAVHTANVGLSRRDRAVDVGRTVRHHLDDALRRGDLPLLGQRRPAVEGASGVIVTNTGIVPRLMQPAGLEIAEWYRLEPSVNVPSRHPLYIVCTYDGRLQIQGFHSARYFTPIDQERVMRTVAAELRQIATTSPEAVLR